MVEKANIEIKKTNISEIKVLENIAYIRVDFDYLESLLIKKVMELFSLIILIYLIILI